MFQFRIITASKSFVFVASTNPGPKFWGQLNVLEILQKSWTFVIRDACAGPAKEPPRKQRRRTKSDEDREFDQWFDQRRHEGLTEGTEGEQKKIGQNKGRTLSKAGLQLGYQNMVRMSFGRGQRLEHVFSSTGVVDGSPTMDVQSPSQKEFIPKSFALDTTWCSLFLPQSISPWTLAEVGMGGIGCGGERGRLG